MFILGVSNDHDRAAYLMNNGQLIVGIEQERLDRVKHSSSACIPWEAISYCLEYAEISFDDVDLVVATGLKNITKLEEQLRVFSNVHVISHHFAHAYSTFYSSSFEESIVFVADGNGSYFKHLTEKYINSNSNLYEAESYYYAKNNEFTVIEKKGFLRPKLVHEKIRKNELDFFKSDVSLGRLYSSVSSYIFGGWEYAGKVMGLAPFGNPERFEKDNLISCSDGQIKTNSYKFMSRFCNPNDWGDKQNIQEYKDLAYKVQSELEKAVVYKLNHIYEQKPCKNICMAGGIALNGILNYRILHDTPFDNLYVVPATGDSGVALGCAYYGYYALNKGNERRPLTNASLGKRYSQEETLDQLYYHIDSHYLDKKYDIEIFDKQDISFFEYVVDLLTKQHIVGWFQGGSEVGPRALGHRSILADPRKAEMKDILNNRVKHREDFRPFGPSVLEDDVQEYFNIDGISPFMLLISPIKKDKVDTIPAVSHIDETARVQTVNKNDNPVYYELIKTFKQRTGVAVLLNTSFNIAGEPIVESPLDAFKSFSKTDIDYLIIDNIIIRKRLTIK